MCGITGFLDFSQNRAKHDWKNIIENMSESLFNRGPDASGCWIDKEAGIAIGHRRLSIIDLSENGAQPMVSGCGRFVLTYNGEIYNAKEIRLELEKKNYSFRGHSDTEVLLYACVQYGIEKAVQLFVGMFAFALWDRAQRTLYLVRDRLGIKPVYWGYSSRLFIFGSELKALHKHPGWHPEIDRDALAQFMRHNYVPSPKTIYHDVKKLQPGHILIIKDEIITINQYWDLANIAESGCKSPFDYSDAEAINKLELLLEEAVSSRLVADVPLGALLSGGIDSSLVVAMMNKTAHGRVRTYSIGFDEHSFNEAHHAKRVAQYLGTEHTELYVSTKDAQDVIPYLPYIYDEPFADSSQIPTYLVSKLASTHVKVALSGDGGDEIFAGYNRYLHGSRIIRLMKFFPGIAKHICNYIVYKIRADKWSEINSHFPEIMRIPQFGEKLYKFADILSRDSSFAYERLISHWENPEKIVINSEETTGVLTDRNFAPIVSGVIERMQLMDTVTYLPDDILSKVDRASMAVSLEARVPLLDHRLVEFAWHIPLKMKIRHGQGKWILRQILYKYIPRNIIERPKMGFGIPIGKWLRGPLREWAEGLLNEKRLIKEGFLNPAPIRQKWHEHIEGKGVWQYQLWNVLIFQSWLEKWGN